MPPDGSGRGPQVQTQRLFVALWPSDEVREQLVSYRKGWPLGPQARISADAGLHLTLHFIGAFPRSQLQTLDGALANVPPELFTLRVGDPTVWPGGIAVLLASPHEALARLHARVGAALTTLGISLDARPFAPHVTFARRAATTLPPAPAHIDWAAEDFVLAESVPAPARGYRVLRRYR